MPVRKACMRKRTCPAPPQLVSTGIFPTGVLFFRIAVYRNIRNFPALVCSTFLKDFHPISANLIILNAKYTLKEDLRKLGHGGDFISPFREF